MRVIEIECCGRCPNFSQTEGYNRVWVCRHPEFRGGINDPRRKGNINGRINKDGQYPKFATHRVASGCPLPTKIITKGTHHDKHGYSEI